MYRKKRGTLHPKPQSIVLDLHPIIALRNISTPFTFLVKTCGFPSNTAHKALNGTLRQYNVNQLTALCLHLNCTPNDLFALPDIARENLPANSALHALRSPNPEVKSITELLKDKSLDEVRGILE